MRANDLESRLVRWLYDERNTILVLYLAAVALGLTSLALFMTGSGGGATRLELSLLIVSGAIIFYMVLSSITNRGA